jgi:RNA-directed DNA polymerase
VVLIYRTGQDRAYSNSKLIIKPAKKSVKKLNNSIKLVFHKMQTARQEDLIEVINKIISGWSNYHMSVNAKQTFKKVDHLVSWKLWKWAQRCHHKKSKNWIRDRYWRQEGNRNCVFAAGKQVLKRLSDTPIVRATNNKDNDNI